MRIRRTLAFAAALGTAACSNGEGSRLSFATSEATARAALQSEEPPAGPTFQSADGLVFTLTAAHAFLRDIRLDLPKGTKCEDVKDELALATCKSNDSGDDSKTILVDGPYAVDLLASTAVPDLSALRIPSLTYRRIDFRLEDGRGDDAIAQAANMVDVSFRASADFTYEGQPARLELALKFNEDARFESEAGVSVSGEDEALVARMDPGIWLQGLPIKSCLDKGDVGIVDGVLRIDEQAGGDCSAAEGSIKENIKRSGDLRKASK